MVYVNISVVTKRLIDLLEEDVDCLLDEGLYLYNGGIMQAW